MTDFTPALQVADAVLFEGYLLYPYRASATKNRMRWQFGVLGPREADSGEPWYAQTECLIEAHDTPVLDVRARFLQLRTRMSQPPWDEGVVRTADACTPLRDDDAGAHRCVPFRIPGVRGAAGESDRVERRSNPLTGAIEITAERLDGPYDLHRVRVRVENHTPWQGADRPREELLRHCLVSTHLLLGVHDGVFVSLLDPPEWAAGAARTCRNEHTWPVLAGADGGRDLMLSSPIILYDHPQTAPESPTDLFDATEIDEILTLRTLAMTDEEKREARDTDPRAAQLVEHVEAMPPQMLERLHGTIRYLRGVAPDGASGGPPVAACDPVGTGADPAVVPCWDPGADASVAPDTDTVPVLGGPAAKGSRVRLRPGPRRADAQDMFLHGREATVQGVFVDVEEERYVAVTLDDDPAADLYTWHGRYLYFAPDEVELCGEAG